MVEPSFNALHREENMALRPKLSDTDVVLAYAKGAIYGQPAKLHLAGTEKAVRRAIIQAVCRGEIEHSGNPERGWLTAKGIALLDPETQAEYRAAILRKAKIVP
jgi:hypothetical protein